MVATITPLHHATSSQFYSLLLLCCRRVHAGHFHTNVYARPINVYDVLCQPISRVLIIVTELIIKNVSKDQRGGKQTRSRSCKKGKPYIEQRNPKNPNVMKEKGEKGVISKGRERDRKWHTARRRLCTYQQ